MKKHSYINKIAFKSNKKHNKRTIKSMNSNNNSILKDNTNNSNNDKAKDIPKIRVIVRKRPISKKEQARNDMDIIELRSKQSLIVKELKTKVDMSKYIEEHNFTFDNAYGEDSTNEDIYLETVRPMIEAAFYSKAKVTCFAYGQTGSGKTHTMMGPASNLTNNEYLSNGIISTPGLYLLSGFDIFKFLSFPEYSHLYATIAFYEIYCGKLFDLLNNRSSLTAREDGKGNIIITNLHEKNINCLNDLMKVIEQGLKRRTVGVTGANNDSSRSHAIIQITLRNNTINNLNKFGSNTNNNSNTTYSNISNLNNNSSNNSNVYGKISFIDLAGSERAQDTVDTNKQTRVDGAEINKSLLVLKECIRALDQNKSHTPFRGSKLTLVLRDSFIGGNCKTLMIANISPSSVCAENTLNTLRYADRVKELKKEKDPNLYLDINNEMMMPRNHNNSVKYSVDNSYNNYNLKCNNNKTSRKFPETSNNNNNKEIICNNNNNNNSNNENFTSNMSVNVSAKFNDYFENLNNKKTENNDNAENTIKLKRNIKNNSEENKENNSYFPNIEIKLGNSNCLYNNDVYNTKYCGYLDNKNKIINNNSKAIINNKSNNVDFINNFNYYNKTNKETETNNREDLKKQLDYLNTEYQNIASSILKQEKDTIIYHEEYVNNMVDSVRDYMKLIDDVKNPGSDIISYIDNSIENLNKEQERINKMKHVFSNIKNLISKEADLSEKISYITELIDSSSLEINKNNLNIVNSNNNTNNNKKQNVVDKYHKNSNNNYHNDTYSNNNINIEEDDEFNFDIENDANNNNNNNQIHLLENNTEFKPNLNRVNRQTIKLNNINNNNNNNNSYFSNESLIEDFVNCTNKHENKYINSNNNNNNNGKPVESYFE